MPARQSMLPAFCFLAAVPLVAAACSDTPRMNAPDGSAGSGGTGGGAATGSELTPPAASGFAVVNGDGKFTSTSLSLVTLAGELAKGDCVHSDTVGGSTTISSDVVLPSQPQRGGKVVLIDRGNTALTFVDPATCAVDHQISVKGGFNLANPHDVVILSDSKAYVTRYEKNTAPSDPSAAGDDVLIVDPRDGTVAGRIDLAPYAVTTGAPDMQARPDRALIAAGKVVVSLNEATTHFTAYAEGHVVVIDPATDSVVQDLALTGLAGCEAMTYQSEAKLLLVVCGGSGGADAAADSGIALVDLSGPSAVLAGTVPAAGFDNHPASFQGIAASASGGSRTAFINTMGTFSTATSDAIPDEAFAVDLDGHPPVKLASSTAFDLGAPALAGTKLLLPDATAAMPRMRVFDVSGTPMETGAFITDTANNFLPRVIAAY